MVLYFRRLWLNFVESRLVYLELANHTKHYNLELVNWRKRCVFFDQLSTFVMYLLKFHYLLILCFDYVSFHVTRSFSFSI
jgi:hypothetical protein